MIMRTSRKAKLLEMKMRSLDCWKKFRIREMRNWVVAKNWQMRNFLLFYATLPRDFFLNCMLLFYYAQLFFF